MKVSILFIAVFFAGLLFIKCDDKIERMKKKMENYASECFKEENLTKEEKQKMLRDVEFAKMRMHCFSACFMKKSGEMNENGEFNLKTISEIESILYPGKFEETMKAISACIEKVKDVKNECDLANDYDKCVHSSLKF